MSNDTPTLREALDLVLSHYQNDPRVAPLRSLAATDDAARRAMQEQFEAWWTREGINRCGAAARCWVLEGWQASRAAAPQRVEPAGKLVYSNLAGFTVKWSPNTQIGHGDAVYLTPPLAPTDAEWQEEAMRLAREWCLSWGEWAHDNDPDCAKENAAEAALRAHIATRQLPAPPTKTKESWQCLLCKSDLAGKHGVLDDGNTPCPNTKKEQS